MFLKCLRASIIGLERADLSVTGLTSMTQRMSAPWVQGRGHKARLEAMSGEDIGSKPAASALFLMILEGISATIARRASAGRAPSSSPRCRTAPYGPSRGLPVTPHQSVEA